MAADYIWEDGGEVTSDPLDSLRGLARKFDDEIEAIPNKIAAALNRHAVLMLKTYLDECDVILSASHGIRLLTSDADVEAWRPLDQALDNSLTTATEAEAVAHAEKLKSMIDQSMERVRVMMKDEWQSA